MTGDFPTSLKVALKEWDIVCRSLGSGRQMILLRKGGISESIGGFDIEHRQFLLFPTFLHQNLAMLKVPEQAKMVSASAEPDEVELSYAGEIVDILQVESREKMDRLNDEHIWTSPLIDMRFSYKPKNPLYLLTIRAYKLSQPVTIKNTPEYAGCKSWVPLERPVVIDAAPVLDDEQFQTRRVSILERMT